MGSLGVIFAKTCRIGAMSSSLRRRFGCSSSSQGILASFTVWRCEAPMTNKAAICQT